MIVYRRPYLGGCLLLPPSSGQDTERVCRLVTDSAMASVYGIDAAVDDPECEMTKITEALRNFAEPLLLPGGYILEIIPFLQHLPSWVPGMQIKRTVENGRAVVRAGLEKLDAISTAANVSALSYACNCCVLFTSGHRAHI